MSEPQFIVIPPKTTMLSPSFERVAAANACGGSPSLEALANDGLLWLSWIWDQLGRDSVVLTGKTKTSLVTCWLPWITSPPMTYIAC